MKVMGRLAMPNEVGLGRSPRRSGEGGGGGGGRGAGDVGGERRPDDISLICRGQCGNAPPCGVGMDPSCEGPYNDWIGCMRSCQEGAQISMATRRMEKAVGPSAAEQRAMAEAEKASAEAAKFRAEAETMIERAKIQAAAEGEKLKLEAERVRAEIAKAQQPQAIVGPPAAPIPPPAAPRPTAEERAEEIRAITAQLRTEAAWPWYYWLIIAGVVGGGFYLYSQKRGGTRRAAPTFA